MKSFLMILAVGAAFSLASCGSTAPTTYIISGTISGLTGTGLVLQDNGGDNLTPTVGITAFTFTTALAASAMYNVTVLTQPSNPAQTCVVTFGTGTVAAAVTNIQVNCTNNTFTIGGSVSGLSGTGLVLQDNGGSNLTISANGSFTFPGTINRGSSYNVTVLTQPSNPGQTCDVANGYGAGIFGNVTAIQVTCFTTTVTDTIGGTVTGLSGSGLILQNNSGNNLPVSASGSFTFSTPVANGSNYSVTVFAQPSNPTQNCVVTGGGGTATGNITGIQVNCSTTTYTIGGTISGLTGTGLVLQDNGGDNLSLAAGMTSFTFATPVASGATYGVAVLTEPSGQTCSITNGTGTVAAAPVTNVTVSCTAAAANIIATVSGLLPNTSVMLQDNGVDTLSVSANGAATDFNTPIASGAAYKVTVLAQPVGATCVVEANGSGTMTGGKVNVAVTCGNIISAGASHTCAVTSAGGVLCWGLNDYGQLGNGSTVDSPTPVPVIGLSSGVVSIAAGYESTCALTNAGSVWCWGDNSTGQLGDGTVGQSNVPVQVLDPTGNVALGSVTRISVGREHACAVTDAGAALCWGDNTNGELGNGTVTQSNIAVPVSGLSEGVADIAAGSYFTCAATTTGEALCWGEGGSGQLGGNQALSTTPIPVMNSTGNTPLTGVLTLSAGAENACVLTSTGNAVCWGANSSGQLGNGTSNAQSDSPVQVLESAGSGPLNGGVAITAGKDTICAVASGGAVYCWGGNAQGELGAGSDSNAMAPVPVPLSGLSSGVAAIAAGDDHACAVTTTGSVQCWGLNLDGQLGSGNTAASSSPVQAVGQGNSASLQLF